ncbi:MAG: hypothetical protein HQ581_10245, partial [Planctomycetes bacterium]|nr:hypothetical protein [Planctomycetota bacterium]
GHESGSATSDAPGSGGPEIQRQLAILKKFIESFNFIAMRPDASIIKAGIPKDGGAWALVEPGRAYAVYVGGRGPTNLAVALPVGTYQAEWVDTKTGRIAKTEALDHHGGEKILRSPDFSEDVALRIVRR